MVFGIPKVHLFVEFCKGCVLRKHHQKPFNSGNARRVSNPLELVHSDIFHINKPSLEGGRYAMRFINDLSYYIWVYSLKNRSHVLEGFKDFRALAEKKVVNL